MKPSHLLTEQGEALFTSGGQPWNVYPRPRLRRGSFFCLNGSWELSVNGGPKESITVPFVPESILSGIGRRLGKNPTLHYFRRFELPPEFILPGKGKPGSKDRILLHFGAVDGDVCVLVNGHPYCSHRGGYTPITLDVTDRLRPGELNWIRVEVKNDPDLPYGKQREKRGGMWYTPFSGIWQTVWMERVPQAYIEDIRVTPRADGVGIEAIPPHGDKRPDGTLLIHAPDGDILAEMKDGQADIALPAPRYWSPEDPYLYRFALAAGEDRVESYFAVRTVETREVDGIPRICLNGRPVFLHALLDQGYFSDGICTPASPENFTRDIEEAKALGFNSLRKHIKIEPEIFYYECDRLGMLVLQDMVNGGRYSFLGDTALPTVGLRQMPDFWRNPRVRRRNLFLHGMRDTVKRLYSHPSVIYWTIFNEGWGQFNGGKVCRELKALDPTRIVDTASGWFVPIGFPRRRGDFSDVDSRHVYFKPFRMGKRSPKPVVLSEFGGWSLAIDGHRFNTEKVYGYRNFTDPAAYAAALIRLYEEEILPAIPRGLCGAVYTQLSDVEDETNGLLTYDRRICKADGEGMRDLALRISGLLS